jgi:hypothetical protein
MRKFNLAPVPEEATDFFINDIGCLRYSTLGGRKSSCVEPQEMDIYLEKYHKIVGDCFLDNQRYIVIDVTEKE